MREERRDAQTEHDDSQEWAVVVVSRSNIDVRGPYTREQAEAVYRFLHPALIGLSFIAPMVSQTAPAEQDTPPVTKKRTKRTPRANTTR